MSGLAVIQSPSYMCSRSQKHGHQYIFFFLHIDVNLITCILDNVNKANQNVQTIVVV